MPLIHLWKTFYRFQHVLANRMFLTSLRKNINHPQTSFIHTGDAYRNIFGCSACTDGMCIILDKNTNYI